MSKEEKSDSQRELILLPLRVAQKQHAQGLIGDLELIAISAVVAEDLGHKVLPDD